MKDTSTRAEGELQAIGRPTEGSQPPTGAKLCRWGHCTRTALVKSLRSAATTWRGRLLHDGLADLAHHGACLEAHCATATAAPDNQTRPHKHTHRVEQGIMHSPPQSTHAPQACWSTTTAHLPTMGGYCKQAKDEVALHTPHPTHPRYHSQACCTHTATACVVRTHRLYWVDCRLMSPTHMVSMLGMMPILEWSCRGWGGSRPQVNGSGYMGDAGGTG